MVQPGTVYNQNPAANQVEPKGTLIQIFVQPQTPPRARADTGSPDRHRAPHRQRDAHHAADHADRRGHAHHRPVTMVTADAHDDRPATFPPARSAWYGSWGPSPEGNQEVRGA